MSAKGVAVLDFGSIPGSNTASVIVSAPGITPDDYVEAFFQGGDYTGDHNTEEHFIIFSREVSLSCIPGTDSFEIYASSSLRLTGTMKVRYVWSNA